MPGLFGLLGFGDPRQVRGVLDAMMVMSEGANASTRTATPDDIALAVVGTAAVPGGAAHVFAAPGMTIALYGQLYEDLLIRSGGAPDGEALLARARTRSPSSLAGLDGEYLLAVWESEPRRLTVVNDRLGSQPFYWWKAGEGLAFAPTLASLASAPQFPTSIDEFSLGDLLTVGRHLDGRTWYSAARSLEPGSILTFTRTGVSRERVTAGASGSLPHPDRFDDDDVGTLLRDAVRRRTRWQEGPLGLLLGGEDGGAPLREAVEQVGLRPVHVFPRPGRCPCTWSGASEGLCEAPDARLSLLSDEAAETVAPPGARPEGSAGSGSRGPIFGPRELRHVLRPEVYRAIQGIAGDAVERAYRDAAGESAAARMLSLAIRYPSRGAAVDARMTADQRAGVGIPYGAPVLLDLGRRRREAWGAPRAETADPLGALASPVHACGTNNGRRLTMLIERGADRLESFFRIGSLRALAEQPTSDVPDTRAQQCAVVGIAMGLERLSSPSLAVHDQPVQHAMIPLELATGRRELGKGDMALQ